VNSDPLTRNRARSAPIPTSSLRGEVNQQTPHHFGVTFNGQQQRTRRRIRDAPVLLPIAQTRDRQMKGLRPARGGTAPGMLPVQFGRLSDGTGASASVGGSRN
jgi:hypothetical protein